MADDRAVGELDRFLSERADLLMRTAVLLTGSRDAGQDRDHDRARLDRRRKDPEDHRVASHRTAIAW
jgi:hypothetical protein